MPKIGFITMATRTAGKDGKNKFICLVILRAIVKNKVPEISVPRAKTRIIFLIE